MYQRFYSEASADDQVRARRAEYAALDVVISKLRVARDAGGCGMSLTDALDALEALWSVLLSDVSSSGNALPIGLRRDIVSIGRWMFSRSEALRSRKERDLDALIDVNTSIRDGLRVEP